jgi:phospholipid transport system substrate-binding protein
MKPGSLQRRRFLAAALAAPWLLPRAIRAQPGPAAPIAALNAGLMVVMQDGSKSKSFASRVQTLLPVVQATFDLPLILQSSVGPRWTSFPVDGQAQLLDAFTQFTVATWVANFDAFDGEEFQILPDLRPVGTDQVVQTRIVPRTGDATRLDYVMRQRGNDWKAVDILLDGSISRVAVQRSDFRNLLRGGDPTPLIAVLRDKVAVLSGSTKP